MQSAGGYDPKKSRVSESTMSDWMRSKITGEITDVPGIGPGAAAKLASGEADDQITTTYQLIGKFLMLKGKDVSVVEHTDRFWFYLREKGITAHRSAIVRAIAEKVNGMMPGVYEASTFDVDDENEEDE
jgi:hypothetical protein